KLLVRSSLVFLVWASTTAHSCRTPASFAVESRARALVVSEPSSSLAQPITHPLSTLLQSGCGPFRYPSSYESSPKLLACQTFFTNTDRMLALSVTTAAHGELLPQ